MEWHLLQNGDKNIYRANLLWEICFTEQGQGIFKSKLQVIAWVKMETTSVDIYSPDSKVHGASMGPIWGRQDPGGPHVSPMNFAIWVRFKLNIVLGPNLSHKPPNSKYSAHLLTSSYITHICMYLNK